MLIFVFMFVVYLCFSLCMIVKNESVIFGCCFVLVKDVVDEIIIVDIGLIDGM